jgi:hypothetical protein
MSAFYGDQPRPALILQYSTRYPLLMTRERAHDRA